MFATVARTSLASALTLALAGACASSPPSPRAGDAAGAASAPTRSCLELANAPRERSASEPDEVHVRHLLVKHRDSKNPREGVSRTREEACERALALRDKVLAGADFDALVAEASDEAGAASRSGDLGSVRRADVVPAFADAAFSLELMQMSDVVETPSGFHLVLRVP
jgi:NIMA-interacting peptidyl-prolyl cis-trans isomerase 1